MLKKLLLPGIVYLAVTVSRVCAGEPGAMAATVAQCAALERTDFSSIQDAPTQVTDSAPVAAVGSAPTYCRVRGYIAPQVTIELQLPVEAWNGKFIEVGCSGTCGRIDTSACVVPLRKGYACIASDMGHAGSGHMWASNNPQAMLDWGYRATHVAALAGKAIAAAYYNRMPQRSYFMGCSTGGRQGMIEAQRFPEDFDGIVAGAPPFDLAGMNAAWFALAVEGEDGRPILSPGDLQLVHKAVLDRCDTDDGIKDGVVSDPLACTFDPVTLACEAGKQAGCLTPVQVDAVRKMYSGPVTSKGRGPYAGGEMLGSELNWLGWYVLPEDQPAHLTRDIAAYFRYMAFVTDPGPGWKVADLNFDQDYKRFGITRPLYSIENPDLRQFQRAGGKLLLYQGWNDPLEVPGAAVDYYQTAERVMGSRAETESFFRLFLIPGMGHCGGGEGAGDVDYLYYLDTWVTEGKAPDRLLGAHRNDPKNIQFTRPIYAYPVRARYRGSGDPQDAASFYPTDAQ